MQRKKPEVDIILDILNESIAVRPEAPFLKSLIGQYLERGFLTKNQLEGLYSKASRIAEIGPGKLATLEAIVAKMPTRYKSLPRFPTPVYQKNEKAGRMISELLYKYPLHKRVLFLKTKYDNNEVITAADIAELEKFSKLLLPPLSP